MTDSLSRIKKMLEQSSSELGEVYKKLHVEGNGQSSEPVKTSATGELKTGDEERYIDFLENLPEMIFIIDREGKFLYANTRCLSLTGYSPEKLSTMSVYDLIIPESRQKIREKLSLDPYPQAPFEAELINIDGEQIIVQFSASPIKEKNGKIIGFQGIASDITLEKNMESQLLHSQKMEAVGTLAGGIAHDFNNLLTVILGNLEMAKIATPTDHQAFHHLLTMEKAGRRAKDLVKQLLQYGRPDKAKKETLCLNKMVDESIRFLRAVIPATVKIETKLSQQPCPIEANPSVITQIITNLSINARDAMPRGGKLHFETDIITVEESYCMHHVDARCGDFCILKISDTGRGMPPNVIERIFEPFFSTKVRSSGAGLGLAVVYTIVKRMGGWISVASEIGLGTEFTVFVPKAQDRIEKPPQDVVEVKGGSEKILFAEDEDLILALGKDSLEQLGYTVVAAKDSQEVLTEFGKRQDELNLIILDLTMPGEGGISILEEIVKINANIPVIIASGYSEDHYSKESLKKASAFVPKPYTPVQMAQIVRDILDRRK